MTTSKRFIVAAAFAAALASPAAFAVTTLAAEVNGMVCAFCAQGIEKNLRALPATRDVHVDLPGRLVAVELKDGATLDPEQLKTVVRDAGYDVVSVKSVDAPAASFRKPKAK
jgi:mercuric ion binding protein